MVTQAVAELNTCEMVENFPAPEVVESDSGSDSEIPYTKIVDSAASSSNESLGQSSEEERFLCPAADVPIDIVPQQLPCIPESMAVSHSTPQPEKMALLHNSSYTNETVSVYPTLG